MKLQHLFAPALFACLAAPALAAFPDHPIKLMVGFAAGGGTDTTARTMAPKNLRSAGPADPGGQPPRRRRRDRQRNPHQVAAGRLTILLSLGRPTDGQHALLQGRYDTSRTSCRFRSGSLSPTSWWCIPR